MQYKSGLTGYSAYGTPLFNRQQRNDSNINQRREVLSVVGTRLDDAIRRR